MSALEFPPEQAKFTPLETLSTEQFRQKLAGLLAPFDPLDPKLKAFQRANAIKFLATLPQLFGDNLDRMTLWDRIASGVESAAAKTANADHEFFVTAVLRHIHAPRPLVSKSRRLADVLASLGDGDAVERQAFIDYLVTHLDAMLVHARVEWERYLAAKAAKADISFWGETLDFEEVTANA